MKQCSKCKVEKIESCFSIRTDNGKLRGQCKLCRNQYIKEYDTKNKEKIARSKKEKREKNIECFLLREKGQRKKHKQQRSEYNKRYQITNKETIKEYSKRYREKNKSKIKKRRSDKYSSNKDQITLRQRELYRKNHLHIRTIKNEYHNNRINKDIEYKIKHNVRARLSGIKKRSGVSCLSWLGCSINKLKEHLSLQFKDNMNWDNYGEWHIDHIKPLSLFDLTDEEQVKKACHYTNLQPLWAKDNFSKGNMFLKKND